VRLPGHPSDRGQRQPLVEAEAEADAARERPSARAVSGKSRDGANSVLLKEHRDGLGAILISGANSPSSLSQVSMRRQVQDDLSKWEMNSAGDPEAQADSRSRGYEFAKMLKASTPLVLPGCRISKSFEAGSQEYPYVPCPHCGEMQVLEWENMQADLDPDKPEEAHFTCIACGTVIEEHHRRQMLAGLEFRAHNPAAKREHRSFWIWSAYSYLQSFERIAREWLKVKGDRCRRADVPQRHRRQGLQGGERGAALGKAARPCFAVALRARHHPGRRAAAVHGVRLPGGPRRMASWWRSGAISPLRHRPLRDSGAHLGRNLPRTARRAAEADLAERIGRKIGVDLAAIDGNAWTEDVWDFAKRHPASQLIMVRGRRRGFRAAHRPDQEGTQPAHRQAAEILEALLQFRHQRRENGAVSQPGQGRSAVGGFVSFPRGLDDEYFRQLTAEHRKAVKKKGRLRKIRLGKGPFAGERSSRHDEPG
jgi:hypothetical protein